jgi:uroporphyrinogen-III decarboxylase
VVPIDQLSVHEDLAGKSGPLIGPNIMDEFVVPYYRRVWDAARAAGAEIFQMDSDGNINPIMDSFIAGGVNSFLPLEPAAGMDMVAVREKYGRDIALVGGIDKFALLGTKADIDRELDYKLDAKMQSGGVVFGLDHRIPNGVHIENYRYYVKRSREMLGLPTSPAPGWERMAM